MSLVVEILAYATLFTMIGLTAGFVYFLAKKLGYDAAENHHVNKLKTGISRYARETAFFVALTATTGSLYFSEVLGWTPCRLCWYQRIFMYPLVLIMAVGLLTIDKDLKDYVIPTAGIGAAISTIHVVTQRLDIESPGCEVGAASCAAEHTMNFGFITVPVMALTAFLAIIVLLWRFDNK